MSQDSFGGMDWIRDEVHPAGLNATLWRYPDIVLNRVELPDGRLSPLMVIPIDAPLGVDWVNGTRGPVARIEMDPYRQVPTISVWNSDAISMGSPNEDTSSFIAGDGSLEAITGIESGSYEVDFHNACDALFALRELAFERGQNLREKVRTFVQRFGPLYDAIDDHLPTAKLYQIQEHVYPPDRRHDYPSFISEFGTDYDRLIEIRLLLPSDYEEHRFFARRAMPLWVYAHEARNLNAALELYAALIEGDEVGVIAWWDRYRIVSASDAIEALSPFGRFDQWKRYRELDLQRLGWNALADMLDDYVSQLVHIRVNVNELGFVNQALSSFSVLGVIYAQMTQIVSMRQLIRQCAGCGHSFFPKRSNQTYCCRGCGSTTRGRRHRRRRTPSM